jgi:hypothetical protein
VRFIVEVTYVKIYDEFETIDECHQAVEAEHPFLRGCNILGELATPDTRRDPEPGEGTGRV